MKKYRVINDLQGADFGMGRDYTLEEWREQAIEWADMDENDGLIKLLKNTPRKELLDTIAEFWQIEFAEVKDILKWEDIESLVENTTITFCTPNDNHVTFSHHGNEINVDFYDSSNGNLNWWSYANFQELEQSWKELLKEIF